MSFRTSLIILNLAALLVIVVVIAVARLQPEAQPGTPRAPEPDAVPGRRRARGSPAGARARDGPSCSSSSSRSRCPCTSSSSRPASRPPRTPSTTSRSSAVRSCSRTRRGSTSTARSRSSARDCHGDDGGGGTAPFTLQPEADKCVKKENQGNADIPECLPEAGELDGAPAQHRPAALQPRPAEAHHHVRQTGYTDAPVGCQERQGRAEPAGHRRPRQLHLEHPEDSRPGEGRLDQGDRGVPEVRGRRPRHAAEDARGRPDGRRRRADRGRRSRGRQRRDPRSPRPRTRSRPRRRRSRSSRRSSTRCGPGTTRWSRCRKVPCSSR